MIKDLVAVKFHTSYRNYNAGEIAGFNPATAKSLVEGGAATYYKKRNTLQSEPEDLSEGDANDARENPDFQGGDRRDLEVDIIETEAGALLTGEEKALVDEKEAQRTANQEAAEVLVAKHKGFGKWFVYKGDEKVSGPHKKKEMIEMGLLK